MTRNTAADLPRHIHGGNMIKDFNTIRQLERESIRVFLEHQRSYLVGSVLDFGAGLPGTCAVPQPYRDLVEGDYVPLDVHDNPALITGPFDAVLCTQVMQYIPDPFDLLQQFHRWLKCRGGYLVMTYPTNWTEIEDTDLWRFTRTGMEFLLMTAGFTIVYHEKRAELNLGGFHLALGYGVVARARPF